MMKERGGEKVLIEGGVKRDRGREVGGEFQRRARLVRSELTNLAHRMERWLNLLDLSCISIQ